jgi:hypothetical protein
MKEKWKYDDYRKYGSGFVRVKQRLMWRFFIRPLHEWFTPCEKCQETIDELLRVDTLNFIMDAQPFDLYRNHICEKCKKQVNEMIHDDATLIIGNADYEPRLELNRQWIDIDETTMEITEEQYKNRKL